MPPLEAWERVLVDAEVIATDSHSDLTCTECHDGDEAADTMSSAHDGLIRDPSDQPYNLCGDCHDEIQATAENSLHMTLAGYDTALYERSVPENHAALEEMQENHCNSCHASCGQCHVSQPNSVGGGLLEGHGFVQTPPMTRTCTGCHGSRIKNEYTGRNEGFPADVHFTQGRMGCVDCHDASEMHGDYDSGAHRYEGERTPTCTSCHPDVLDGGGDAEIYHETHTETVSCQVCHSVSYKNCAGCHTQQSEEAVPYFEIEPSWMDFRIGLNNNITEQRPWEWIVLRHVPISRDSVRLLWHRPTAEFRRTPNVGRGHTAQHPTQYTAN